MKKESLVILIGIQLLLVLAIVWWFQGKTTNKNTGAAGSGNIYYVATNGNNANPGTQTQPWATFSYANSRLQPGDTLLLLSGTYNQKLVISVSGTAQNKVSVKAAPGNSVIIDAQYAFNPAVHVMGSYVDISDLTIKNGQYICELLSGNSITSSNITVTGCFSHGTMAEGSNIVVQTHTIYNTNLENQDRNYSSGWGSGLKVSEGANGVSLRNNTVYNNYGEGIAITKGANVNVSNNFVYDNYGVNIYVDNSHDVVVEKNLSTCTANTAYQRDGKRPSSIYFGMESYSGWGDQFYNVTVQNNLFAFCNHGILYWNSEVATGGLDRVKIYNNTIIGSIDTAITINSSANHADTFIVNNLVQQSNNKLAYIPSASGLTFHHNFWTAVQPTTNARGTGDVIGQPQFLSIPVYNQRDSFRIAASSPTIDKGAAILTVVDDVYGSTRPYNMYDIGAQEYSPLVPSPTPTPTPEYPAALKNVYTTFSKLRYNKYASPSQLYSGDTMYIKNYDTTKIKLIQVFLYDYAKKGNQGFTKSRVTTTSMFLRTNYLLPTGKRYAYVAKFQDIKTGIIATKYFVVYTTTAWNGQSTL